MFSLIVVATYSLELRGKMLVMCFIEMGVLHSLFVPILSFVISRVFVLLLLDSSEVTLRVGTNFQVFGCYLVFVYVVVWSGGL